MKNQEKIQSIKSLSIESYLQDKGFKPIQKRTGKWVLYPNPLRPDNKSNFYVNTHQNYWTDFARQGTENDKGDIIDLVQYIEGLNFNQAVDFLASRSGYFPSLSDMPKGEKKEGPIKILRTSDITHPALKQYLTGRSLSLGVAGLYLKQVNYELNGREFFAVGFKNDKGGWELRNKHVKTLSISPKWFTFYKGSETSNILNVFEGWPDFLAVLTYYKVTRFHFDTVVLNGVGMLPGMALEKYTQTNSFLDNDEAGRKSFEYIQSRIKYVRNVSQEIHPKHKDFNDYLKEKRKPSVPGIYNN